MQIVGSRFFPENVDLAIKKGFERAETEFLSRADSGTPDTSGSCALITLFVGIFPSPRPVDETCFVANVGDSRALLSSDKGETVVPLSRDHKPCDELEQKRILTSGGSVYRANPVCGLGQAPLRVLPGRLSVSRTIGDAQAKLHKFGGNPKVVIPEPEIRSFRVAESHDFVFMGCILSPRDTTFGS